MKKKWSKAKLDAETNALKNSDFYENATVSVQAGPKIPKRGRPSSESQVDLIKTNLDLPQPLVQDLDALAAALNISRQAIIKTFLMQGLTQYYLGQQAKKNAS